MPKTTVVILAAGQGTRMRSATPKVLHDLLGRPVVAWPTAAAHEAGADTVVVVGGPDRALAPHLPEDTELAVQHEARGTGDAVLAAREHIGADDVVVIIAGDVPLITAEAIRDLADAHRRERVAATMATMVLDDPTGYGRVVRDADGSVLRVAETKRPGDATQSEMAIREVNTGVYAFDGGLLVEALEQVSPDNAQGEYYLPDALTVLAAAGHRTAAHGLDDPRIMLGINDRADLARVRAIAQERIHAHHLANGVGIVDPATTTIEVGVTLAADVVVEPATFLRGHTNAEAGARLGPCTTVIDSEVGARARVLHSYLDSARVGEDVSVGPFAYLRPGADLGPGAKAGTFVEIKNSTLGPGAKVPHLSYIGDADVGESTNLGASTITANYDGRDKHRTTIGERVRSGVHVSFVAPVTVGDGAVTAAGSTITEDVPEDALAVARERQRNVEGYARRGDESAE